MSPIQKAAKLLRSGEAVVLTSDMLDTINDTLNDKELSNLCVAYNDAQVGTLDMWVAWLRGNQPKSARQEGMRMYARGRNINQRV